MNEQQIPKLAGSVVEHQHYLSALSTEEAQWAIQNMPTALMLFSAAVKQHCGFVPAIAGQVREALLAECEVWRRAYDQSKRYIKLLRLTPKVVAEMECMNRTIEITIPRGVVRLISKHTCAVLWRGDWVRMIQARPVTGGIRVQSIGGGTTYATALDPEVFSEVRAAILAGNTALVDDVSIWP